ncbi:pyrroline-5-carboxylate reductase family protein [Streptomyces armeniacus]|uniref:pyrroline-5-carboxylate reductase family protein n=1 Tax=Streptomyces armeniacus TaxID=83291 RepID=UPI001AD80512|nr:pyrroline-5-carboxylate reductase dimerization domain-containing protein [Streptomyces armeniacus]
MSAGAAGAAGPAPGAGSEAPRCAFGFVGCGRIVTATVRGLVASGHPAEGIVATSRTNAGASALAEEQGIRVAGGAAEVVRFADTVVLAVDPAEAPGVVAELAGTLREGQLLVSFVASYRLATLEKALHGPVVRAVPNVALAVREGVAAVAAGQRVERAHWRQVHALLGGIGHVVVTDDASMELVSAVAGAGPALFSAFGEALAGEAVARGLDETTAKVLVAQSLRGTGVLLGAGMSLPEIAGMVASPGGMTRAALDALAARDISGTLGASVDAALDVSHRRLV